MASGSSGSRGGNSRRRGAQARLSTNRQYMIGRRSMAPERQARRLRIRRIDNSIPF